CDEISQLRSVRAACRQPTEPAPITVRSISMRLIPACVSLLLIWQPALAQEPLQSSAAARQAIETAMQSAIRPETDKARDTERKPLEVLSFFRLESDMRVIEILPFGGWFTKIIGPVVRDEGMLYTVQP